MINIAICDDEQIWMDELERQIVEVMGEEVVISMHTNPFSLMTYIVDTVKGKCDVIYIWISV